jgi:hypothetical protein
MRFGFHTHSKKQRVAKKQLNELRKQTRLMEQDGHGHIPLLVTAFRASKAKRVAKECHKQAAEQVAQRAVLERREAERQARLHIWEPPHV